MTGKAILRPSRPTGRPSAYRTEVVERILQRMAAGETLTSICRDRGMPAHSTVRLWAAEDRNGFSAQYARAREAQAHALAEAALDEAMTATGDAQLARLRFDAARWFVSKMLPKVYGPKAEAEAVTLDNPLVALLQNLKGSALKPVHLIDGEADQ
ncbi:hypothetical protein [Roseomonas sp. 18066]|uniref:terminase small subunit-like protein n=1 Tax=Roseomonas sp. 18066 TaxID=2681412 RepID=UPI0034CDAF12